VCGQILQFAPIFVVGTVSKLELESHVAAKKNTWQDSAPTTFKFTLPLNTRA
jgi:hypothetical protein